MTPKNLATPLSRRLSSVKSKRLAGLSDYGKKSDLYRRFIESLQRETADVATLDPMENAPEDEADALVNNRDS
jgi:hypothetical protein